MPNRLQVSCILRRVSGERVFVEALGGWSSEGTHWWLSPEVAIQGLEGHRWQFYIDGEEGRQIRLVVAEWEGQKYLKAECDDQDPVALLALPECSSARKILENWERSTLQRTGWSSVMAEESARQPVHSFNRQKKTAARWPPL